MSRSVLTPKISPRALRPQALQEKVPRWRRSCSTCWANAESVLYRSNSGCVIVIHSNFCWPCGRLHRGCVPARKVELVLGFYVKFDACQECASGVLVASDCRFYGSDNAINDSCLSVAWRLLLTKLTSPHLLRSLMRSSFFARWRRLSLYLLGDHSLEFRRTWSAFRPCLLRLEFSALWRHITSKLTSLQTPDNQLRQSRAYLERRVLARYPHLALVPLRSLLTGF